MLDLFCCQGGASAGYVAAGFEVTGVDRDPQARYPFEFVQADALRYLEEHGSEFDFIHASPPCQSYTKAQRIRGNSHPELIKSVRWLLNTSGKPWVIENVPGSERDMGEHITLCGAFFGLHTYRHRLFEAGGGWSLDAPAHLAHTRDVVKMGRPLSEGDWYHAVGNFSGVGYVKNDLNVPWMNRDGIRECIPPVYAEYVGTQFLAQA